jgi:hypothetical protein
MFFLFVGSISMGNLGISFDRCCCCCIYLFVYDALITVTLDVIRTGKKGRHLNTMEKYHMYRISRNNSHMNDTYIDTYTPIFQNLHELYDR